MVDVAVRPPQLSGCWKTWDEQDVPRIIRTTMENGAPKVRRRWTGRSRQARASVILPKALYNSFMGWFLTNCQAGVLPTNMVEPVGIESAWRFVEPPQISWPNPDAFQANCLLERLSGWP